MQKGKIIVIISIIITLMFISIVTINNNSNSSYIYEVNGIKYAVLVDGVTQTSLPAKGMYRVDVTCKNATCKWLYDEWELAIEYITGNVSCYMNFVTITKTYLNDYVIELEGTTQGTGQVVNENGYRYEGKNPNNYIWFNNELWRIIGVFDENSHGQSDANLVKIMREDSIGAYVRGSGLSILVGDYLNAKGNYLTKGIQDGYREMVQASQWYSGKLSSYDVTTETAYVEERDSGSTSRKIGLIELFGN